jgi:uncharacterized protein YjbJ (UPF0337 family)
MGIGVGRQKAKGKRQKAKGKCKNEYSIIEASMTDAARGVKELGA